MSENGSKKREWVKTAAIIFLAVLLVLTFFSNTIQNYSLPEVATNYVQSGTITAKIRGTGTVESGDPYEVKVTESRKVTSVAVRVGDTVEIGDVILYLDDTESDELVSAREALESAQKAYDLALLTAETTAADVTASEGGVSAASYRQQITAYQQAITAADKDVTTWTDEVARLQKIVDDFAKQIETTPENSADVSAETTAVYNAQQALNDAQNTETAAKNRVETLSAQQQVLQSKLDNWNSVSNGDSVSSVEASLNSVTADLLKATESLNAASAAVKDKELALTKAKQALETKKNKYDNTSTISSLTSQKNSAELSLYEAQKKLADVTSDRDEKKQKLEDLVSTINRVYNLEDLQDAITKAKEQVDELTAKTIGATVNAEIAGTVTAINVTAGNTTSADTPVAVLQPEGKGYTMSFSVTNEQAKRLSVGDKADLVNSWRYDDVDVTLASIRPDTTDPGQKKLLTFDVTGSVTAGQSLSISVGQKSASFDYIVPNSAVREDNNGKFILIVESKSSPLGNRYVATRVDVEVLASDDTQSAISGGVTGYEYVITTSSAPVEAGKLVRLSSN